MKPALHYINEPPPEGVVLLEDYWGGARLWNEDSAGFIIYEPDN